MSRYLIHIYAGQTNVALAPSASPCAATEEQVDLDLGVMTGVPRNPSTCPDLESAARRLSQLTEEMNEDKSSSEAQAELGLA